MTISDILAQNRAANAAFFESAFPLAEFFVSDPVKKLSWSGLPEAWFMSRRERYEKIAGRRLDFDHCRVDSAGMISVWRKVF